MSAEASQLTRARYEQMEQRLGEATAIIEGLVYAGPREYSLALRRALVFLNRPGAPQAEGAQP